MSLVLIEGICTVLRGVYHEVGTISLIQMVFLGTDIRRLRGLDVRVDVSIRNMTVRIHGIPSRLSVPRLSLVGDDGTDGEFVRPPHPYYPNISFVLFCVLVP